MTGISKPYHIIGKNHRSHPGQGSAVLLIRTQPTSCRSSGMTMRTKNAWSTALVTHWTIEITVDEETGTSLEDRIFNRIPRVGTLA